MEKTCKNFEKCPIYSGILKDRNVTAKVLRIQFCDAGERGWLACKRYLVNEKKGICPPDLLPNDTKSIDQIIKEMNLG
jgi:hypothetical protein